MQILNLTDVPGHLDTLARWHQEQWQYFNPRSTLAERIERMKAHLSSDFIPTTFVAADRELLGSAAIIEHDMDTRKELSPWLASVFVAPAFRRRGIGSTLVRHVMEQARQNQIQMLYLFTPDREGFYAKLGWETLEKTPYRGYDVTIMRVNL